MQREEAWLRGPIEGITPLLMPAAHAFVQAVEEAESIAAPLDVDDLWMRPGGAASAGFHLRHIAGVVDRLFTYARGEELSPEQLSALQIESEPGNPPAEAGELLRRLRDTIHRALGELGGLRPEQLLEPRLVGRKKIPSNVIGLVFHAAEHAQRHTGQLIATTRIIEGAGLLHYPSQRGSAGNLPLPFRSDLRAR